MPQQNYLDELTPAFTSLLAIKEASRCLLCHDAPCSQAWISPTARSVWCSEQQNIIVLA